MIYNSLKRRHFLQGLGVTMAMPLLPSLMPKAHAALGDERSFVFMSEEHGGVNEEHLYPYRNPVGEQVLYAGNAAEGLDHKTRMEPLANLLQARTTGLFPTAERELSPVFGSFLNPFLPKINLLRGLDIMFYIAHHQGGYLGNFSALAEVDPNRLTLETIDQIMARSTAFYKTRPTLPIMQIGSGRRTSFARQSGTIQEVNSEDNWAIVNAILGTNQPVSNTTQMTQYLNRINEDYSRLMSTTTSPGRRLSTDDRLRVEEHVGMLNELISKLVNQGGAICSNTLSLVKNEPAHYYPSNLTTAQKIARWENTTNLIAGAIKCGASRIAIMNLIPHIDYDGDWHQAIAHRQLGETNADVLRKLTDNSRFSAQQVFTRLIAKLDVERGDGSTYLDNSLVTWTPESGPLTHMFIDNFALTAGSAGGYFKTGNYVDYRNLSNMGVATRDGPRTENLRPGMPYNRWIYGMLKAMGIPDSEFARAGMNGYGDNYVDTRPSWFANANGHRAWPDRLIADLGKPMPRITA